MKVSPGRNNKVLFSLWWEDHKDNVESDLCPKIWLFSFQVHSVDVQDYDEVQAFSDLIASLIRYDVRAEEKHWIRVIWCVNVNVKKIEEG